MFKIVFLWLLVMAFLADIVLIVLKWFDVLSWGWDLIIAIPFVVAIVGTLAFGIIYLLVKIFVTLVMGS